MLLENLIITFLIAHFFGVYSMLVTDGMSKDSDMTTLIACALINGVVFGLALLVWDMVGGYDLAFLVLKTIFLKSCLHFSIEFLTASVFAAFNAYNPNEKKFWYIFGLKEMAHLYVLVKLSAHVIFNTQI